MANLKSHKKLDAALAKHQAEQAAWAEIGSILAVHLDALSICSPKDTVKIIREIVVVDRTATLRLLARRCRELGLGALARNLLEAAL
jgi:hypothetical protein